MMTMMPVVVKKKMKMMMRRRRMDVVIVMAVAVVMMMVVVIVVILVVTMPSPPLSFRHVWQSTARWGSIQATCRCVGRWSSTGGYCWQQLRQLC